MPAPEIAQREGIHQLQESPRADAAAALRAERALRENRFWLDAAHALVRVLEAMGETQSAQRMAGETEHLVRLYPTLLSARFADGSPMAGELSSAWLRQRLGVSPKPAPEPVSERTHAVSDSRDDLPAHLAAEKKRQALPQDPNSFQKARRVSRRAQMRTKGSQARGGRISVLCSTQPAGLHRREERTFLQSWPGSCAPACLATILTHGNPPLPGKPGRSSHVAVRATCAARPSDT